MTASEQGGLEEEEDLQSGTPSSLKWRSLLSSKGVKAVGAASNAEEEEEKEEEEVVMDGDDGLQFEMEPLTPAEVGGGRGAEAPSVASDGGWRGQDGDEEEEQRQAILASLAELAASPPISRLASGAGPLDAPSSSSSAAAAAANILSSSPPSSLMAPDRALGSQMARIGLGCSSSGPGSLRSRPPVAPRAPAAAAGASPSASAGWIGAWERGLPSPSGAGGSPGLAGTSPSGASQLPRLSTAAGPGLRSLVLAGCGQVSAEGLRLLLAAPGRKACLEALDVSRCQRVTRQALMVPPGVRDGGSWRGRISGQCLNPVAIALSLPLFEKAQAVPAACRVASRPSRPPRATTCTRWSSSCPRPAL